MRTLVICPEQEIDGNAVKEFLESFAHLDAEKGPIEVRICCQGGWTEGAMAIHDAIKFARNEVTTVGMGVIASAAVVIMQAGHKRLMAPNATIFLHETSMHTDSAVTKLQNDLREAVRLHTRYCKLIADRAGLELETILTLCKEETYLSSDVASTLKLTDGIMGRVYAEKARRKQSK